MASFKEKLFFEKPTAVMMLAFQEAARAAGLKTSAQERFRLSLFEVPMTTDKLSPPIFVEIRLASLTEGTGVELSVSNLGIGASQNDRVREAAEELKGFLMKELDKPAQEEERLAKIRAREQREAEERAKEAQEDARMEATYQQKVAQLKAAEESLQRRLPAGRDVDGDTDSGASAKAAGTYSGSRTSGSSAAASSLSGSGGPSLAAELQHLAELHDSGILDDEEFKAAKRALLTR